MPCKIIFVLQVSLECRAGNGVTGTGWMGMASLSWLSPRLSGQQLSPFPHALVGLFFSSLQPQNVAVNDTKPVK